MQKSGGSKRIMRALGVGILSCCVIVSLGTLASTSSADEATPTTSAADDGSTIASTTPPPIVAQNQPLGTTPPYGSSYPVTLETDFSRPLKAISSQANSDFSLLDDLERLIRGSYIDPRTGGLRPVAERTANRVDLSISRMENSHRVGRELIAAAKHGVSVYVIHGKASQSSESRALARSLAAATYNGRHYGHFHICAKGKSLACLSSINSAIMHSKILYVRTTFTRNNDPAKSAIWSGSANLGGPSGERTWNNGLTIYNDKKLSYQITKFWDDMWSERNVNNDYLAYVKAHSGSYGYNSPAGDGYTDDHATYGMFYSNLANVTIYPTPIYATPTNGKDPVLSALSRVIPDDTCRIRVQHNRFKYRRLAVAQKLVDLANKGCKVSAIAFEDDLKVNRAAHCQLYIRICQPILDVLRTANVRIEAAWAKPHDKTMLIDANMGPNPLNPQERQWNGAVFPSRAAGGARVRMVQAGSAALTGSNLVVSDEVTTETTDPEVFEDYLEHWKAIWKSREHHDYLY